MVSSSSLVSSNPSSAQNSSAVALSTGSSQILSSSVVLSANSSLNSSQATSSQAFSSPTNNIVSSLPTSPVVSSSSLVSSNPSSAQNNSTANSSTNSSMISSEASSQVFSSNSSTNPMPVLTDTTNPITGTIGMTDMKIIKLNSNYSIVPNGTLATFEPKDSGVVIEGVIQGNNFVPKIGSIIPLTAKEGISIGVLDISNYGKIIVNTDFRNKIISSAAKSSMASSEGLIVCANIYPSPCSNSSIPTCQEIGLSICNNSSVAPIGEGQTSQMSQVSSASINQGTDSVDGNNQTGGTSSLQNSSTTSSIALIFSSISSIRVSSALSSSASLLQISSQAQTSSVANSVATSSSTSIINSTVSSTSSYSLASSIASSAKANLVSSSVNSSKPTISSAISSSGITLAPNSIPNNGDGNYDGIEDSKQPKVKTIMINNNPVTIVLKNSDCKGLSLLKNLSGINKQWVEFRANCSKTEIETIWHGFDTKLKYKLVKYNPNTKTSKKWSSTIKVVGKTIVTTHSILDDKDGDWNSIKTEIWDPYTLEEEDSVSSILDVITPRSGGEIIYLPLFVITIIGGIYVFSRRKITRG